MNQWLAPYWLVSIHLAPSDAESWCFMWVGYFRSRAAVGLYFIYPDLATPWINKRNEWAIHSFAAIPGYPKKRLQDSQPPEKTLDLICRHWVVKQPKQAVDNWIDQPKKNTRCHCISCKVHGCYMGQGDILQSRLVATCGRMGGQRKASTTLFNSEWQKNRTVTTLHSAW